VWDDARRELDCWEDADLTARFWVRDDDAFEMSQNLERLCDLATRHNIKIGLAVIPGKILPDLSDFLGNKTRQFHPMCHGWKHVNHNRSNRPAEFGYDRPISSMIIDAQYAFGLFSGHFGALNAIFVPPFNRITPTVAKALPGIGFAGVSSMPSQLEHKILQLALRIGWSKVIKIPDFSGVPRIDAHVDMINWKTRAAHETTIIADHLVRQLRGRRLGVLPADTPIGLLTHHLAHDEGIWRACDETLEFLRSHRAAEFFDVAKWAEKRPPKLAAPVDIRVSKDVS
jgi:hypothetical protein